MQREEDEGRVGEEGEASFWGEWHRIGNAQYAVAAVPERFPALLLAWLDGSGLVAGLILTVIAVALHRRQQDGPWATAVLCDRTFRLPRVVDRARFPDQLSADQHARRLDAELAAGRLPART